MLNSAFPVLFSFFLCLWLTKWAWNKRPINEKDSQLNGLHPGVQYLTGENLKVVWAEFSTHAISSCNKCMAWHAATSRVENSAQGVSCHLKFVHDSILNISGSKNNQILPARFVIYWQKIGPNVATFKTMVLTQNVVRVQGTHVSCYSQHYIFFVAYESAQ